MSENALGAAEWNSLLSSPILHGLPLSPKQMASSTKCSHICLPSVQVRLDLAERFELWGLVFERHELRHPRSTSSEVPGKAGRRFFHEVQSFFTVSLPTARNRVREHGCEACDATRRPCRGRHTIIKCSCAIAINTVQDDIRPRHGLTLSSWSSARGEQRDSAQKPKLIE